MAVRTTTSVHVEDGDPIDARTRPAGVFGRPYVELSFGDHSEVVLYLSPRALRALGELVADARESLASDRDGSLVASWD
jgi:hypothetical protein